MKLPDTNLLVYAVDESSPFHLRAEEWLRTGLSGSEPVGFSWVVLLGFLRVSTNSRLFGDPLSVERAFNLIESWLGQPCAVLLAPTEQHASTVRRLLESVGTAGNLTSDADLAALSLEYEGEVFSADADFGRFSGVRWTNPFA